MATGPMKTLDEKIEEMRVRHLLRFVECVEDVIDQSESPIERAMLWGILSTRGFGFNGAIPGDAVCDRYPGCQKGAQYLSLWFEGVTVSPQVPVAVGSAKYRLDIAIGFEYARPTGELTTFHVAVECDGHDFHERTKQQAERDKKRDRDLQSIGWRVLRFTGSEIVRDPDSAGRSVWMFLRELAAREG
jgi:hypothetical protein